MKIYQANPELENILKNQGFVETTSLRDRKKGKKSFKRSEKSKKEIYFDYINISILNGIQGQDSRISISEDELKCILLYFKLSPNDVKEIIDNGQFNLEKSLEQLKDLEIELKNLTHYNLREIRRKKIKRIIDSFKEIKIQ